MDVKYSRACRKVVFGASAASARVADATKPKIAACFVVAALVSYSYLFIGPLQGDVTVTYAVRPDATIGPIQRDGTVTYAFRPDATREPSIRFEVCEGLTNQRIAIVQGVAIGYLTGLPIVLPSMHTSFVSTVGQHTKFSDFYDEGYLRQSLEGVRFAESPTNQANRNRKLLSRSIGRDNTIVVKAWNLNRPRKFWEMLGETAKNSGFSIEMDCAFNSLHTHASDTQLGDLLWSIDEGLVPSPAIAKEIQTVRAALDPSGSGVYAALHVRIEDDWVEHCKKDSKG
jgi:hypothetical protein